MTLKLSTVAFSIALFCLSIVSVEVIGRVRVDGSQKYLIHRLEKRDKRYASFLQALKLLKQRRAKVLVETGTARNGTLNFSGDGGSTIIFGHWASQNQAKLYSVDINPDAVINAQGVLKKYGEHVEVICADSIGFLADFDRLIDFLYLDSYDFDFNNPLPSQLHHLNELSKAYSKLHKDSIVMIDDCDLPHGGKGLLAIEYLLERGWKIIFQGYQVILVHSSS